MLNVSPHNCLTAELNPSNTPSVSLILISYNSAAHLQRCFEQLAAQTFYDFEIILVDNGSGDFEALDVENIQRQLSLRIERLPTNLGFAAANNIGVRLARGKWVALLNPDAYPDPDWLEHLTKAAETNPGFSSFASRQIQYHAPHLLDGAGDSYPCGGQAQRRFYGLSAAQYGLEVEEVFGACAAAALYRREDFLAVGGFDERYFSYFEDVDLSFRLRLAGGRCLYVPQAVVHHIGSASTGKTSDFSYYHIHRNMVWTFFKNMPAPLLPLCLPSHLWALMRTAFSVLIKQRRGVIFKALWDAVRGLPAVLRSRGEVQSLRKVRLRELYRIMRTGRVER